MVDEEYYFDQLEEIRIAIYKGDNSKALSHVRILQNIFLNKWKEKQLRKDK